MTDLILFDAIAKLEKRDVDHDGDYSAVDATPSGAANTFTAWTEFEASVATAFDLEGVTISTDTASTGIQLEIGSGAAASEVSFASVSAHIIDAAPDVYFPFPEAVRVPVGTRLAWRSRSGAGGGTPGFRFRLVRREIPS